MTELEYIEQLRLASKKLAAGDIGVSLFEEICITACTRYRGQPPEGRMYVVGIVENRILVGHVECAPFHLRFPRNMGQVGIIEDRIVVGHVECPPNLPPNLRSPWKGNSR